MPATEQCSEARAPGSEEGRAAFSAVIGYPDPNPDVSISTGQRAHALRCDDADLGLQMGFDNDPLGMLMPFGAPVHPIHSEAPPKARYLPSRDIAHRSGLVRLLAKDFQLRRSVGLDPERALKIGLMNGRYARGSGLRLRVGCAMTYRSEVSPERARSTIRDVPGRAAK